MDEMRVRHIVIKVILNEAYAPRFQDESGQPANVKIIRANSDNETLTVDVKINKISGWQGSDCTVTISGMLIDDINAMTKVNNYLFFVQQDISNIEVYAGYEVNEDGYPPLVYSGAIYESYPDLGAANKSRPLTIKSLLGWEQSGVIVGSFVEKNQIPLKELFEKLASNFKGCSTIISGADDQQVEGIIFQGSAMQQLQAACANYGFQFKLDDNVIKISPIGEPMMQQVLTISPDDNLLNYPMPQMCGVAIRVRFNPAIQFGQRINLITDNEAYAGLWWVNGMSHHLTNRAREWESTLQLNRFNITEGA